MTPCEERGYEVGDRFLAKGSPVFVDGSIVELFQDDGTPGPLWKLVSGSCDFNCVKGEPGAFDSIYNFSKLFYDQKIHQGHSPITTLRQAKAALDKAQFEYDQALADVQQKLGNDFVVSEAENSEPQKDMADPANWRVGDVFRATSKAFNKHAFWDSGRDYVAFMSKSEGCLCVADGDGDNRSVSMAHRNGLIYFHHRPF